MSNTQFISVADCVLVVIDIQEKLFRFIYEKEKLLDNTLRIIQGAQVLGMPVILTEQYPQGLGPTLPEITNLLADTRPLAKKCFSCYGDNAFRSGLEGIKRKQVLITGIECHVCVYQTTVDLLNAGYGVHVLTDCVSSRTADNRQLGLQRMAAAGAKMTSVEMALFELLGVAEGEKFKAISKIVK